MGKVIGWLLFCFSASACAQSIVTSEPRQCVWRSGDNPAWAAPSFDDSAWEPLSKLAVPDEPHLWVRCRLPLDGLAGAQSPSVMVVANAAYELFVQGAHAGTTGNLVTADHSEDFTRIFPLSPSAAASGQIVFALRITYRVSADITEPVLSLEVGSERALRADRAQGILDAVRPVLGYVILYCILGVVGAVQLGLFLHDRSRLDLLWLSIFCIFTAMLRVNTLAYNALVDYPIRIHSALYLIGNLAFIFQLLFFFALARKRVPTLIWALWTLSQSIVFLRVLQLIASPELSHRLGAFDPLSREIGLTAWTLVSLSPFVAFWPWNRIPARLRFIAICCFLWALSDFVFFATQTVMRNWLNQTREFARHAIVLYDARAFIIAITVLLILALLFRDQRRITEERAVLAGEMQAAREIQTLLAPRSIRDAPGFRAEVAFHPVQDVGGDFYQVIPAPDSTLIVIGDVSGKGLRAAMTGTLAVGALRTLASQRLGPAALLNALNRQIVELNEQGFITCLCARISPDGALTLANAGHLAPYRNGEEVQIESGLPLGIIRDATYAESTIRLVTNDQLTFLSDGVVEAQSASGELFGFDRTRSISSQSAEEIARAAQAHGQQDDITVLTLTFAGAVAVFA